MFGETTPDLRILRSVACLTALAISATAAGAAAAEPAAQSPSWIASDPGKKTVTLDVVAAWNSNNSALNFNGYHDGDATIVIPVGWSATFNFSNNDAALPHSLLVTKPYAKADLPVQAGTDLVAIPRAYTNNPAAGLAAGQTDNFQVNATAPGEYDLLCGAPGHAQGGMWFHLSLRADAAKPGLIVAPGADPGR